MAFVPVEDKFFDNKEERNIYKALTYIANNAAGGDATAANQETGNTSLDSIDKKVSTEAKQNDQITHEARTSLKNQNQYLESKIFNGATLAALQTNIDNFAATKPAYYLVNLNTHFLSSTDGYTAIAIYSKY